MLSPKKAYKQNVTGYRSTPVQNAVQYVNVPYSMDSHVQFVLLPTPLLSGSIVTESVIREAIECFRRDLHMCSVKTLFHFAFGHFLTFEENVIDRDFGLNTFGEIRNLFEHMIKNGKIEGADAKFNYLWKGNEFVSFLIEAIFFNAFCGQYMADPKYIPFFEPIHVSNKLFLSYTNVVTFFRSILAFRYNISDQLIHDHFDKSIIQDITDFMYHFKKRTISSKVPKLNSTDFTFAKENDKWVDYVTVISIKYLYETNMIDVSQFTELDVHNKTPSKYKSTYKAAKTKSATNPYKDMTFNQIANGIKWRFTDPSNIDYRNTVIRDYLYDLIKYWKEIPLSVKENIRKTSIKAYRILQDQIRENFIMAAHMLWVRATTEDDLTCVQSWLDDVLPLFNLTIRKADYYLQENYNKDDICLFSTDIGTMLNRNIRSAKRRSFSTMLSGRRKSVDYPHTPVPQAKSRQLSSQASLSSLDPSQLLQQFESVVGSSSASSASSQDSFVPSKNSSFVFGNQQLANPHDTVVNTVLVHNQSKKSKNKDADDSKDDKKDDDDNHKKENNKNNNGGTPPPPPKQNKKPPGDKKKRKDGNPPDDPPSDPSSSDSTYLGPSFIPRTKGHNSKKSNKMNYAEKEFFKTRFANITKAFSTTFSGNARGQTLDDTAKNCLRWIFGMLKWHIIYVQPNKYFREEYAVEHVITKLHGQAFEQFQMDVLHKGVQFSCMEEFVDWLHDHYMNEKCYAFLRKEVLAWTPNPKQLYTNLPTAFDEFDHQVAVYNQLLDRLSDQAKLEYEITEVQKLSFVKSFLLRKKIMISINNLRHEPIQIREPRTYEQLKQSMQALHTDRAYMREINGFADLPSSPTSAKNDPTSTSAGAHVNFLQDTYRDRRQRRPYNPGKRGRRGRFNKRRQRYPRKDQRGRQRSFDRFQQRPNDSQRPTRPRDQRRRNFDRRTRNVLCFRCGKKGHVSVKCFTQTSVAQKHNNEQKEKAKKLNTKNLTCRRCGKRGHVDIFCRSANKVMYSFQKRRVHSVQAPRDNKKGDNQAQSKQTDPPKVQKEDKTVHRPVDKKKKQDKSRKVRFNYISHNYASDLDTDDDKKPKLE